MAIVFPVFMIADLLRKTSRSGKKWSIVLFYALYFALIISLCLAGAFDVVTLPPRIILITTLPLLLFYLLVVSNTAFYKSFLKEVTLSNLVRVHLFRLIGSFFLILFFLDRLPLVFAVIAGMGDIITAVSSVFLAKAIERNAASVRILTIVWNTFGLADIVTTSAMAVYLTKQSMETGSLGVDVLAQFPFCLIPAFAPATIIFLHFSVYLKLFRKKYA